MTGTGALIRLILRRDRLIMSLWVLLLGALPAAYVTSFEGVFSTDAERITYARISASNAGFLGLYGPLEGSSLGELVAWRAGFLPVMIGLASLLTVIRHTRADEEAGRTELIGSGVVGRHAGLAAALIAVALADVALGAVTAAGLASQGLPGTGSILLGASFTAAGWLFAAVGAVTAQLAAGARAARMIAISVLAGSYVLRMAGDMGDLSALSWASPLGWVTRVFPYGASTAFPLVLCGGTALLLVILAVRLAGARDVGAGVLPARLGPANAAPTLAGPLGLAWRLHRGTLLGWVVGFVSVGALLGSVTKSTVELTESNPAMLQVFERMGGAEGLVDSMLASLIGLLGVVAAAYAVQAALRMRDEENTGHTEAALAGAAGRLRWVSSHLLFALLGPACALLAGGLGLGLVAGLVLDDVGGRLPGVLGGAAAQLPAVWVLAGLTMLLFGALPRQAPLAWVAVSLCWGVLMAGAVLDLDQWVLDISPFTHVPHLPGGAAPATPLVALTAVAAALTLAGLLTFRRRDVPTL